MKVCRLARRRLVYKGLGLSRVADFRFNVTPFSPVLGVKNDSNRTP